MNNDDYKNLASDLIHNAFSSNQNPRGKISDERQYAEMILRKLLDWDQDKKLTLGDSNVQKEIRTKFDSDFATFILDTVEAIRDPGNKSTHTQHRDEVTQQQLDTVTDAVFDLLASLFINYFNKYRFASRSEVPYSFSFLPPIIRYKVLDYLYKQEERAGGVAGVHNILIIDKLVLAILKHKSEKDARDWVEKHKTDLLAEKAITSEAYEQAKKARGEEFANHLYNDAPNMYDSCLYKIENVSKQIEKNGGLLYTDFETAKKYYLENGILDGIDPEIFEFNDLMEFVYLGRLETENAEVKPPLVSVRIEPTKLEDFIEAAVMDELTIATAESTAATVATESTMSTAGGAENA